MHPSVANLLQHPESDARCGDAWNLGGPVSIPQAQVTTHAFGHCAQPCVLKCDHHAAVSGQKFQSALGVWLPPSLTADTRAESKLGSDNLL